MDLLQSPLHDRHEALGAKFAEFSGWLMPLEYGGVLKEHAAVRDGVGVFDVSHLGKALVRGPGAADFVNACLTNDLGRIHPGKAQYTLCCDDDGGVIDDIIAYLRSDDEVFLIPNAANNTEVVARLSAAAPDGIEVINQHRDYAVLAVQGTRSDEVLDGAWPAGRPRVHVVRDRIACRSEFSVCRTGYTGERGYELVVPSDGRRRGVGRAVPGGRAVGPDRLRPRRSRHPAHRDGVRAAWARALSVDLAGDGRGVVGGGLVEAGVLGQGRAGRPSARPAPFATSSA